jgi:type II secretory pathway component GspD/PulD (secretin)
VIPNPFDNTLLIQSTLQEWEQINGLLDQLDVPPRQVLIDVKIYELDLNGAFSAGVQAFLDKERQRQIYEGHDRGNYLCRARALDRHAGSPQP